MRTSRLDWQVQRGADRYTLIAGDYKIVCWDALQYRLYFRGMSVKSYQSMQGAKIGAVQHARHRV